MPAPNKFHYFYIVLASFFFVFVLTLSSTRAATRADGSITSTAEINDTTTNGPTLANSDTYGIATANMGDLNSDGVNDIAVGAYLDFGGGTYRGAVHISFLNTDGSVDSTVEINDTTTNGPSLADFDFYGSSIANMGDLNSDGVKDIAVGASGDDAGGGARGAVHISFLNTDGSVDSTVEINDTTTNGPTLANNDVYGVSVANIGDLNGDGVNDIAVGATGDDTGGGARGAVHISFLNTDGSVDSTVKIDDATANGPSLADSDSYGTSVANIGDLNGDGVNDIAVGATGDDTGGTGRGTVHISFMNTDGSIDSTVEISSNTTNGPTLADSDSFGVAIANLGDFNNDGVNDIAVGASGDDSEGNGKGAFHVSFLNTDGSIDSTIEINDSTTNGATLTNSDSYGVSIANMGDLNDDDVNDIAIGASGDDEGGSARGAVHLHFMYGVLVPEPEEDPSFSEDTRCHWSKPPETTWIKLKPSDLNGVKGMLVTWTQYSADKVRIKIDDGTGRYPWVLNNILNDGNEFIPNVYSWQNLIIKPSNHCKNGPESKPVNQLLYPSGWYNLSTN